MGDALAEHDLVRDEMGNLSVLIIYQGHRTHAPVAGQTILAVKRELKDQWGIPYLAEAFLNGYTASATSAIYNGDLLRFVRPGFKAGEESIIPPAELLDRFPEIRTITAAALSTGLDRDQTAELVAVEVLRFCLAKFGPPDGSDRRFLTEAVQLTQLCSGLPSEPISRIEARLDELSSVIATLVERMPEVSHPEGSPYLDVNQAAVYCKVRPQTIYNNTRKIRAHRSGRAGLLFTRQALDEWMAKRTTKKTRPHESRQPSRRKGE
jgi:hypothetical protein